MNIFLLRICSVPIRISSPELHVAYTCFSLNLHVMERYLTTTYRLYDLYMCIQGGYVTTTYLQLNVMR